MGQEKWAAWQGWLASKLRETDAEIEAATQRRNRLHSAQVALDAAVRGGDDDAARATVAPFANTSSSANLALKPSRERSTASILSSTGALLLAAAAIVFTAVAWNTLGVLGQGGVLLAVTVTSVAATPWAQRRHLDATAEALAWLSAAMAAIDVVALATLGVLKIGDAYVTATAAAASGVVASVLLRLSPHRERAQGATVNDLAVEALRSPWQVLPFAIATFLLSATSTFGDGVRATLAALLAAGLAVVSKRAPEVVAWQLVSFLSAVYAAVFAAFAVDDRPWTLLAGLVVAALLVGRGVNVVALSRRVDLHMLREAVGWLLCLVVVQRFFSAASDSRVEIAILVALGCVAAGGCLVRLRGSLVMLVPFTTAFLICLANRGGVQLAASSLALVVATFWLTRLPLPSAAALGALAPLTAGLFASNLGLSRNLVILLAVACSGVIANAAVGMFRRAGSVTLAALGGATVAGAAAVLLSSVAEATRSGFDRNTTSIAFLLVAAGAAGVSRLRVLRAVSVVTALGASALAYWTVLPAHTLLELQTIPVALVWGVAGKIALGRTRQPSMLLLGPALLVAAVPSAMLCIGTSQEGQPLARPVLLVVLGAASMLLATRTRLIAPLLCGTFAVLAGTLGLLGPWVVALPRWLTLGTVGLLLLVAGARFESVRAGVTRARGALTDLR